MSNLKETLSENSSKGAGLPPNEVERYKKLGLDLEKLSESKDFHVLFDDENVQLVFSDDGKRVFQKDEDPKNYAILMKRQELDDALSALSEGRRFYCNPRFYVVDKSGKYTEITDKKDASCMYDKLVDTVRSLNGNGGVNIGKLLKKYMGEIDNSFGKEMVDQLAESPAIQNALILLMKPHFEDRFIETVTKRGQEQQQAMQLKNHFAAAKRM